MEPVSKQNFHEMNLKNQVINYIKCEGAISGLTIFHIVSAVIQDTLINDCNHNYI